MKEKIIYRLGFGVFGSIGFFALSLAALYAIKSSDQDTDFLGKGMGARPLITELYAGVALGTLFIARLGGNFLRNRPGPWFRMRSEFLAGMVCCLPFLLTTSPIAYFSWKAGLWGFQTPPRESTPSLIRDKAVSEKISLTPRKPGEDILVKAPIEQIKPLLGKLYYPDCLLDEDASKHAPKPGGNRPWRDIVLVAPESISFAKLKNYYLQYVDSPIDMHVAWRGDAVRTDGCKVEILLAQPKPGTPSGHVVITISLR